MTNLILAQNNKKSRPPTGQSGNSTPYPSELWQRFDRVMNTANDEGEGSICHRCKHATRTEIIEPRVDPVKFPGLNESWYASVDRSTYQPSITAPACKMCFEDWVDDKREEGKICIKCGIWVQKKDAALIIESRYAEGKLKGKLASRNSLCTNCLTGGKSIDEWAKEILEKKKKQK